MSAWAEFLTKIQNEREVTLVGPLYRQRHIPLMPTIYVDGGAKYAAGSGWAAHAAASAAETEAKPFPVISVGDGDSAAGRLDELLPPEKDYSDLAFALRSLPAPVTEVTLLGFLGGRRDHELAVIGEAAEFLRRRPGFARVDLVGNSGDRMTGFAHGKLEINIRGSFSVFVFEPSALEIGGACKYRLPAGSILQSMSSAGLSNEGYGLVEITSHSPCFVVTT